MFLAVTVLFGLCSAVNWCSEDYECYGDNGEKVVNTMCKYAENLDMANDLCELSDFGEMKKIHATFWLAMFNSFRDRVAAGTVGKLPPAANMKQLVWSSTLEKQATRWAYSQCTGGHDPCNSSPVGGPPGRVAEWLYSFDVGNNNSIGREHLIQLFALTAANNYDIITPTVVNAADEILIRELDMLPLTYTLMAGQRFVGAALLLMWKNGDETSYLKSNTYWAPELFYESPATLYKVGEPCSRCPDGYQCNKKSSYKHLCALEDDPSDQEYVDSLPGTNHSYAYGSNVTYFERGRTGAVNSSFMMPLIVLSLFIIYHNAFF